VASGDLMMPSQGKVWFDGGGNSYIHVDSNDHFEIWHQANQVFRATGGAIEIDPDAAYGAVTIGAGSDLTLGATDKLYFDGGSDTYIQETAADNLVFHSGGLALTLDSSQNAKFSGDVRTQGVFTTDRHYLASVSGSTTYTIASAIPIGSYDHHRWFIVQTHNNYSTHISYGYVTRQGNNVINLHHQEIIDTYGGSLAITDNGDNTYDLDFTAMSLGGILTATYDVSG